MEAANFFWWCGTHFSHNVLRKGKNKRRLYFIHNKKKLQLPNYDLFRMHVSRSYTIFYRIYEEEKTVKVLNIMMIEEAHKRYGML